eukprot:tig00020851_g14713.t1
MGLACSAAAAGQEDAGKASKPEQPPPRPPPTSIPAMSIRMHAQRFAGESFPEFAARTMLGEAHKKKGDASEKNYVFNRLEPFRNAKNDKYAPTWPAEDAEKYAAAIRDERFLEDLDHPEFSRRISWLYPDDGCMVRAELVRMKAVERGLPMPAKVFSFGSLAVKSENAPVGEKHIYWGWHVAALVRVNGVLMAIDPSIEYEPMMPLQRWYDLQTQGPVAGPLEGASICHGYSYDPDSECEPSRPEPEEVVFDILDEDRYLGKVRSAGL